MPVLLALLASILWGAGDYLGARAARTESGITVAIGTQFFNAVLIAPFLIFGPWHPTSNDVWLGLVAGAVNGIGYPAFVYGAAKFSISIVMPVSGVVSAAVPVIAGQLFGDQLGVVAWIGIATALVGIVLVSSADRKNRDTDAPRLGGLEWGVISGVMFGLLFVCLSQTSDNSGPWPVFVMRASAPLLMAFAVVRGVPLVPRIRSTWLIFGCSITSVTALVAFTVASRVGTLGVVAVLSSLAPVGTVFLARWIDDERVTKVQAIGVGLSLASIGLLSVA